MFPKRSLTIDLRTPLAVALTAGLASAAHAQDARNVVSACSGVSLPRSTVTEIVAPVVNGIVTPTQSRVNGLVNALPVVPPLSIDSAGLLAGAAAGDPITLRAIAADGSVVGPDDRCDLQADSYGLNTEGGIAIGGNRITGLGTNGREASAGSADAIAFGNGAATSATAGRAIALGADATATAADSVALGAGSVAARGPASGYAALRLAAPQSSAGEVSVGAAGAERQITNVAAGSAPTDAVNVAQLAALGYDVDNLADLAVRYDDPTHSRVTLGGGAAPVALDNVAPGTVSATSTDAVNGAQLFATNANVAANTTAITNLSVGVANGAVGPVRYSNPGSPTMPNGGVPTNDVTLVGAAPGAVGLHNVADGRIAAGSTDAVNGGQVYRLAFAAVNAVSYDADADGSRTNTVTLTGGDAARPVAIRNLAAGAVTATSTDAHNGGQLYATDQAVATAQSTADGALALGRNSVQYDDPGHTTVTLGAAGGAPVALHNVATGISPTDAVNVAQLGAGIDSAVSQSNAYTDDRIAAISYDVRKAGRRADAGTAGALAAAGLPQAYGPGKGMISMAMGAYGSQTAVAVGMSKAMNDGHTVVKLGGTYDTRSRAGASAGVGYQF